jgi:MoaA/NifB/PqqE/SkfB family radical SAM enzyme
LNAPEGSSGPCERDRDQPYSNHNGGQLQFGPDGFLYVGMGDGGSGGDPGNRAQNPAQLLGKMLRIDVESGAAAYAVPDSNPFRDRPGYRPEIWALGLASWHSERRLGADSEAFWTAHLAALTTGREPGVYNRGGNQAMPASSTIGSLWRRARREASWLRDQLRPAPREVLLETTRACNLRCFHCAVGEPGYQAGTLSWEAFARTLPFLRRHRPLVHLNGHGETLLHGRFVEMFQAVIECGCRVGFQTNGMLLTPELTRRLLDIAPSGRFAYVRFSVDAADKPLFDQIRINGDFDLLRANVRFLKEERARRGTASPTIQLEMCAMLQNVHHLPGLVRLTHELGGAELCVSDIIEYARARGQRLIWSPERAVPFWVEAGRVAEELGVTLSIMPELRAVIENAAAAAPATRSGVPDDAPPRTVDAQTPLLPSQRPAAPPHMVGSPKSRVRECRDPWRLAFVDAGGNVMPCCVVSLPMGNISQDSLGTIWHGERYRAVRRLLASRSPLPQCIGCFMRTWAPMPLVLRAREAVSRAASRVAAIGAAPETRFGLFASSTVAHRNDTVTVDLSVVPGRSAGHTPVDVYVTLGGPDGGGAYLDGRGFSPRPTPLLVAWEPFVLERFAIATLRVPATWADDHLALSLAVVPHQASPLDPEARRVRAEAVIAIAPR